MRCQWVFGVVSSLLHFSSQLQIFEGKFPENDKDIWSMSELKWKEIKRSFKIFDELNGDFIGNVLEKYCKENNDSIARKFVSLFMRAKWKDYDFAGYGDICESMPKIKLRDFTNMYSLVLGDAEEQLKLSNKIFAEPFEANQEAIVMQKVHLQYLPHLLVLFETSNNFCDFRRLMRCDEQAKCCKCPEGMTMEENIHEKDACRLLPEQNCDLKKEDFSKMDILVTKESLAAVCLRNSECALRRSDNSSNSSNPLSSVKTCQCKYGFFGEYCQGKAGNDMSSLSKTDYGTVRRLYPEEIINDLMNLMKFRNRSASHEERERKVRELYRHIALEKFTEEIIENDVQIRNMAKLLFGDRCSPQLQIKLDNPPLTKQGREWMDPDPQSILAWQTYLLLKGIPLCNYLRNLRCGSLSKVCECREGLLFEKGECLIQIGFPCHQDFNAPFQFDALQDKRRFSAPHSPHCVPGSSCLQRELFFSKRCWCTNSTLCGGQRFNENLFSKIHRSIHNRFSLNLGESCDPNIQAMLLNPDDGLPSGFDKRLASLAEIANSTAKLCRIDRFGNCSEFSRKCECWKDFVLQNGECRRKNMDICGQGFLLHHALYEKEPAFPLQKIAETFAQDFVSKCVDQSTCIDNISSSTAALNIPGRCMCTNSKFGTFCNDSMSSFASVLNDPDLIAAEVGYIWSTNEVFHEINLAMLKLENFMSLKWQEDCDVNSGRKLDVIVKFWKDFLFPYNVSIDTSHRANLQKAISWIIDLSFPRQFSKFSGLCDSRLGLTCSSKTQKCECLPGTSFGLGSVTGVCKLDHNEICPTISWKHSKSTRGAMGTWIPQCHSTLICTVCLHEKISRCLHCNETTPNSCLLTMRNLANIKIPVRVRNHQNFENQIKRVTESTSDDEDYEEILSREITTEETIVVLPQTNKEFLESFEYLFKKFEIFNKLEITEPCDYKRNYDFFKSFRILLEYYDMNLESDDFPENLGKRYIEFTRLLQEHSDSDDQIGLCDWGNYAECSKVSKSCVCMYHHHLVIVDKECRLKVNEVCEGQTGMKDSPIQKRVLRCEDGSTCESTDFGPNKCRLYTNNDRPPSFSPVTYERRSLKTEVNGNTEKLYKCPSSLTLFSALVFSWIL